MQCGRRIAVVATLGIALSAFGADEVPPIDRLWQVHHRVNGTVEMTPGRLLLTAQDGGLLLETRDGQLLTVTPADLVSSKQASEAFQFSDADEVAAELQTELGPEFEIVRTRRYVIATNAGTAYGQWCGRLFERLHTALLAHWKRAGLELNEPQQPLVAIILATPEQYAAAATREAAGAIAGSLGFYSVRTNRMVLADLTRGSDVATGSSPAAALRRLDSQSANVATLVHEATHQVAFNCGLHQRYADNPMWLTEGLAMFCEAPDLRSATGWRTIGKLHAGRLQQFRDFAATRRSPGSLQSLVTSDDRFRDPTTAIDAYAESWALTWFLFHEQRPQYVEFLRQTSQRPRLVWDTPTQRQQNFEANFGTDWNSLERAFITAINRLPAG